MTSAAEGGGREPWGDLGNGEADSRQPGWSPAVGCPARAGHVGTAVVSWYIYAEHCWTSLFNYAAIAFCLFPNRMAVSRKALS